MSQAGGFASRHLCLCSQLKDKHCGHWAMIKGYVQSCTGHIYTQCPDSTNTQWPTCKHVTPAQKPIVHHFGWWLGSPLAITVDLALGTLRPFATLGTLVTLATLETLETLAILGTLDTSATVRTLEILASERPCQVGDSAKLDSFDTLPTLGTSGILDPFRQVIDLAELATLETMETLRSLFALALLLALARQGSTDCTSGFCLTYQQTSNIAWQKSLELCQRAVKMLSICTPTSDVVCKLLDAQEATHHACLPAKPDVRKFYIVKRDSRGPAQ